jgi:hypothetical protein
MDLEKNTLYYENLFSVLDENYSENLHQWMKTQYSDVCSDSDVVINNILDKLSENYKYKTTSEKSVDNNILLSFNDIPKKDYHCIEHIHDFYANYYLKNKESNPFWAD